MTGRLGLVFVGGVLVVISWIVAGFIAHGLVHAVMAGWNLWAEVPSL